jgi:hypothetical protein
MRTQTVELIADGEDLILPLPQELMTELGWHTDDVLVWTDNKNGTWSLSRKDTNE